mmetsp:Transcript_41452/g.96942  ORF Transcript_41452/g.96942 Transcript_41452/m.96942 type:complete len:203 (+) Transcript_41452:1162-1770(+)
MLRRRDRALPARHLPAARAHAEARADARVDARHGARVRLRAALGARVRDGHRLGQACLRHQVQPDPARRVRQVRPHPRRHDAAAAEAGRRHGPRGPLRRHVADGLRAHPALRARHPRRRAGRAAGARAAPPVGLAALRSRLACLLRAQGAREHPAARHGQLARRGGARLGGGAGGARHEARGRGPVHSAREICHMRSGVARA